MTTTIHTQSPETALAVALAAWRSADHLAIDERALLRLQDGELAFLGAFSFSPTATDGGAADAGYDVIDGVAVVPVEGALMATGSRYGYWDGYDTVATRAEHAHKNAAVRAVCLAITSPGGMVAGMFDGMRALRAAAKASGKRMVAWVGSAAFSAAYGLASTCDEICVDELAGVGSIGVIDAMVSRAAQAKAEGVDVRVVSSGAEKTDGHPYAPITDEAVARKRARVDELAQAFAREINAGRPSLSPAAALALDGGIRYGRAAVAAGLADRVTTRAALLAELSTARATPTNPSGPRGSASTKDTPMHEKLFAMIAAKTGETDPDRQMGALGAMFEQAAKSQTVEAELAALRAEQASAKAAAEKADRAAKFEAALAKGQADAKLTPAEAEQWRADFERGECSLGVLEGNLARRAPIAALSEEHRAVRPPAAPAANAATSLVAQLSAKPYGTLTWDERNTFAALAPDAHERALNAWVEAGRPRT